MPQEMSCQDLEGGSEASIFSILRRSGWSLRAVTAQPSLLVHLADVEKLGPQLLQSLPDLLLQLPGSLGQVCVYPWQRCLSSWRSFSLGGWKLEAGGTGVGSSLFGRVPASPRRVLFVLLSPTSRPSSLPDYLPCRPQAPAPDTEAIALERPFNKVQQLPNQVQSLKQIPHESFLVVLLLWLNSSWPRTFNI